MNKEKLDRIVNYDHHTTTKVVNEAITNNVYFSNGGINSYRSEQRAQSINMKKFLNKDGDVAIETKEGDIVYQKDGDIILKNKDQEINLGEGQIGYGIYEMIEVQTVYYRTDLPPAPIPYVEVIEKENGDLEVFYCSEKELIGKIMTTDDDENIYFDHIRAGYVYSHDEKRDKKILASVEVVNEGDIIVKGKTIHHVADTGYRQGPGWSTYEEIVVSAEEYKEALKNVVKDDKQDSSKNIAPGS